MSMHDEERPIDYEVPEEEGVDPADVAERLDEDPEDQPNYTEQRADDEAE